MAFKRLVCNSATEALVKAAENADEMQHVVILYNGKDGEPDGIFCDNGITEHQMNWMLDQFKMYLFRHVKKD